MSDLLGLPGDLDLHDLLALDLEYRLTVGFRAAADGCGCVKYLISRREVLLPEIMKSAAAKGVDPVEHFAAFARRLHAKHEETE